MKTVSMQFNSLSALGRYLSTAPRTDKAVSCGLNAAEDNSHFYSDFTWARGMGFRDSIDMALSGGNWVEGTELMKAANIETSRAMSQADKPIQDYSVTGHTLDVPEFLSGSPCHFLAEDEDEDIARAPIIKIGVGSFMSCNVDQQQQMYRGAAILSLVDELENQGYRVELWAVMDAQGPSAVGEPERIQTDIAVSIKQSDEQWSPANAAFMLAHSAYTRRLMFRLFETESKYNGVGNSSYGQPCHERIEGYDLYFPSLTSNEASKYRTAEDASEAVLNHYHEQVNNETNN